MKIKKALAIFTVLALAAVCIGCQNSTASGSSSQSSSVSSSAESSTAESSASQSTSDEIYEGIDVSVYQGNIDFSKVKDSGIELVYIRAGIDVYEDSQFQSNYEKASAEGLHIGFYYYVSAKTTAQARQQAEKFAQLIENKNYDAYPAMDFEATSGLSQSRANAIALAFLTEFYAQTGVEPIVYTDAYDAKDLWQGELADYRLWIADYSLGKDTYPDTGIWAAWDGYQYSDVGRISGISDDVDLDIFKSSILIK